MTVAEQGATAPLGRRSLKAKMRTAVLTERIDVDGPEVAIFRFKPKDHDLFEFVAGQYATLGLDVGDEFVPRAYSIASSPYERSYLELYINVIGQGQLTPSLFSLRHGDEVYYMGPKGVFTLAKSNAPHLLLFATGTGLAPYVSMLRTLSIEQGQGKPHGRMITLGHGVRYTADLGYRWELDGLSRHKEFNFLYVPMASRPQEDRHWMPEVGRGRVTALLEDATPDVLPQGLDAKEVQTRFPPGSTAVYLCGNPDMISDARSMLSAKGYEEIYTEEYW
jgi:ferredoxin/flavodoxin---NADP+ reductase